MGFFSALSKIGKVMGRTVEVGKRIGGFIARHHQHIAPLAQGLAVASGNATAQKITGLGLAASQMATTRKGLIDFYAKNPPMGAGPATSGS